MRLLSLPRVEGEGCLLCKESRERAREKRKKHTHPTHSKKVLALLRRCPAAGPWLFSSPLSRGELQRAERTPRMRAIPVQELDVTMEQREEDVQDGPDSECTSSGRATTDDSAAEVDVLSEPVSGGERGHQSTVGRGGTGCEWSGCVGKRLCRIAAAAVKESGGVARRGRGSFWQLL